MQINEFPVEILDRILEEAAALNERDGVTYTFGFTQAPQPYVKPKIQRYVRGTRRPDTMRWDAAASMRHVCSYWHNWALSYSLKDLYIKKWQGSERWANLPQKQSQYMLYEIAADRNGPYVYKDPFAALPSELQKLLVSSTGNKLYSLELQAVDFTDAQRKDRKNFLNLSPLSTVDFSTLRRLKFIGDSTALPVTDRDLLAIARTATNLEEFHITCLSTISIHGVMAIVEASQQSLRVLEHSPRSQDGFFHPHPGYLPSSEHHICDILASCPRMESLSISVPSMCASLFSNPDVKWKADCQIRAAHLCNQPPKPSRESSLAALRAVLASARQLIKSCAGSMFPRELYIELFFADCIFEPGFGAVHGVFRPFYLSSGDEWPNERQPSRKGPYGSTGLYGKDEAELEEEEELFERVQEAEFLRGVDAGWVSVDG